MKPLPHLPQETFSPDFLSRPPLADPPSRDHPSLVPVVSTGSSALSQQEIAFSEIALQKTYLIYHVKPAGMFPEREKQSTKVTFFVCTIVAPVQFFFTSTQAFRTGSTIGTERECLCNCFNSIHHLPTVFFIVNRQIFYN